MYSIIGQILITTYLSYGFRLAVNKYKLIYFPKPNLHNFLKYPFHCVTPSYRNIIATLDLSISYSSDTYTIICLGLPDLYTFIFHCSLKYKVYFVQTDFIHYLSIFITLIPVSLIWLCYFWDWKCLDHLLCFADTPMRFPCVLHWILSRHSILLEWKLSSQNAYGENIFSVIKL